MTEATPQAVASDPPRSSRVERTRSRILEAAGQEFGASGYAKTTVERIARTAGVSKALLYHHFRGKEEILEGVMERTLADWDAAVGLERRLEESESVLDAIAESIRGGIAYATERPLVLGLLQLEPELLLSLGRSRAVKASTDQFRVDLETALRRGVRRGEVRKGISVARSAATIQMMQMALVEHLLDPEYVRVDEAQVEETIDLLVRGLAGTGR